MTAERSLLLDLESCVAPAHCAVVVIDMQNDFCALGGWTETVVKKDISSCKPAAEATQKLVAAARAAGVPVLWVRADYSPERLPAPMQARNQRMGMTEVCCAPGTWGADWYVVRPAPGEAVLTKHGINAAAEIDACLEAAYAGQARPSEIVGDIAGQPIPGEPPDEGLGEKRKIGRAHV